MKSGAELLSGNVDVTSSSSPLPPPEQPLTTPPHNSTKARVNPGLIDLCFTSLFPSAFESFDITSSHLATLDRRRFGNDKKSVTQFTLYKPATSTREQTPQFVVERSNPIVKCVLSMKILLMPLVVLFVLFSLDAHAQNIVKWVDENGVVHFGTAPPPGRTEVEEVRVQKTNSIAVPSNTSEVAQQATASTSSGPRVARIGNSGAQSKAKPASRKSTPFKKKKRPKGW